MTYSVKFATLVIVLVLCIDVCCARNDTETSQSHASSSKTADDTSTYNSLINFLTRWAQIKPTLDSARNFVENIPSTSKVIAISDKVLGIASDIGSRAFEGGLLIERFDPDLVNYVGAYTFNLRTKVTKWISGESSQSQAEQGRRSGRAYYAADSSRYKNEKDFGSLQGSYYDSDYRYDDNVGDSVPEKSQYSRGGGYGGGGHGGGGYGGGGYGGGGGYDSFSVLGGLAFLTFLGVLLYAIATRTRRSIDIDDLDDPLLASDLPESVQDAIDSGNYHIREPVFNDISSFFNRLWRDHKKKTPLALFCGDKAEEASHILDENIISFGMIIFSQAIGQPDIGRAYDLLKSGNHERLHALCSSAPVNVSISQLS